MLTKTSVFDVKYFRYVLKRMFPYSLVMALVLILSSFLMYGFGDGQYLLNGLMYYDPQMIGLTANIGMYIIPIALSIGMFGFLHKKNSTDFIFGAPVKRTPLFITSIIAAFIIIAATLLLNFLFVALMIEGFTGNIAIVAPQNYVLMYFYNLAGYMLVFVIASFAATLTGTALSQLLITFVVLLLPAYIICYLQLPFVTQYSGGYNNIEYIMPLNTIALLPDIASAPLTMIFMEASGSHIANYFGTLAYFANIRTICFTILLTVVYAVAGVYLFKRYKSENSGRAFINKGVNIFAYSGVFAPIMLIVFYVFAEGLGYDDMIGDVLFYIFVIFVWVAFVIASLIFNKGFSGFGKQMKLFFTLLITTCIVSGLLYVIGDNSVKTFNFRDEEVKEITVYLEPINTGPVDNQNVKGTFKKVKINDPDLLSLLSRGDSGRTFFFDVVTEKGKKLTLRSGLSELFINEMYNYIDEHEDIKKSLFSYSGAKNIVGATLTFKSEISGTYSSSYIDNMKEIKRMVAAKELEYLDIPTRDLYMSNLNSGVYSYSYYNGGIQAYYEEGGNMYLPVSENSLTLTLSALRYDNGQYFISHYTMDYDSEFFTNYANDIHKTTEKLIRDIDSYSDSFEASLAGAFDLDDEQYLNLSGIIESLPNVMREEFIEAIRQAIKEPIIPENTVGIYISTDMKQSIIFMNIDRDLKPLIEKYFDKASTAIRTSRKGIKMALGALIDGTESLCTGFFSNEVFAVTPEELADLIIENEDTVRKLLTDELSAEELADEYYFVHLSSDPYYAYDMRITMPITAEMLQQICPRFDYFESEAYFLDPENIDHIFYENNGKEIRDRDEIEYLTSLLKYHYFLAEIHDMQNTEDSYYYDYKYENYYAYYDMRFVGKDGQIEFAQIPETDHVTQIIKGTKVLNEDG